MPAGKLQALPRVNQKRIIQIHLAPEEPRAAAQVPAAAAAELRDIAVMAALVDREEIRVHQVLRAPGTDRAAAAVVAVEIPVPAERPVCLAC
jgi:hypothetical protein